MLALRRLLAGAAVITLAVAPRPAYGQDTTKAAPSTHTVAPAANTKSGAAGMKAAAAQIDINTAGKDSLMTLMGIGDAYAAAIIIKPMIIAKQKSS
jgi:DNA uptake protein ComE-like DNA-binding protein